MATLGRDVSFFKIPIYTPPSLDTHWRSTGPVTLLVHGCDDQGASVVVSRRKAVALGRIKLLDVATRASPTLGGGQVHGEQQQQPWRASL